MIVKKRRIAQVGKGRAVRKREEREEILMIHHQASQIIQRKVQILRVMKILIGAEEARAIMTQMRTRRKEKVRKMVKLVNGMMMKMMTQR